jgi:hypothetical protein
VDVLFPFAKHEVQRGCNPNYKWIQSDNTALQLHAAVQPFCRDLFNETLKEINPEEHKT